MKKVLCVFLAILTLSFCFVLNVSAEGVNLMDYDYKRISLYNVSLERIYNKSLTYENIIEFLDSVNFDYNSNDTSNKWIFNGMPRIFMNNQNIFNQNTLKSYETLIDSIRINNNGTGTTIIQLSGNKNHSTFTVAISCNIQNHNIDYSSTTFFNYTEQELENILFYLYNDEITNIDQKYGQYKFNSQNNLEFINEKSFKNYLSNIFDNMTYIEPEEMAMRANVTYSLPYVINYVKIVVNSIFTPTGALYTLAPVAIISIAISVLLLGAYIIKRFSWGLQLIY